MKQQSVVSHRSINPCIIVRFLDRAKSFLGIQNVQEVEKTKKEKESDKGQEIINWAKLALKRRDVEVAEEFCCMLQHAIDIGGYGDTAYLRRELRKVRNGIDCVSAIKK